MKLPAMWPQAFTVVVLLLAMVLVPVSILSGVCGFAAGMIARRVLVMWTAERRLRLADEARTSRCTCHAPGGYPHEPDCAWWERNCK